jgi:hypothetical protein
MNACFLAFKLGMEVGGYHGRITEVLKNSISKIIFEIIVYRLGECMKIGQIE